MELKKLTKFINIENNKYLFLIILVGVVFMLFAGGGDNEEKVKNNTTFEITTNDEERLRKILSEINGVGAVDVMITYYSTPKTDIAYEINQSNSQREEKDSSKSRDESYDKQAIMSSGEPFVTQYTYPEVKGVVVAAEGVGSPEVKQRVVDAVTCAFNIAPHKVYVAEKHGG